MKKPILIIDTENVSIPKDLDYDKYLKVIFVIQAQKHLKDKIQVLKLKNSEIYTIDKIQKDNMDFHIVYIISSFLQSVNGIYVELLSNDTGFDDVISSMNRDHQNSHIRRIKLVKNMLSDLEKVTINVILEREANSHIQNIFKSSGIKFIDVYPTIIDILSSRNVNLNNSTKDYLLKKYRTKYKEINGINALLNSPKELVKFKASEALKEKGKSFKEVCEKIKGLYSNINIKVDQEIIHKMHNKYGKSKINDINSILNQ